MIESKQAMFRLGYSRLPHKAPIQQELTENRIIITNAQGVELQILVQEDGSFKVYLDNVNFIPLASNHFLLVSKRYRG